MLYDEVKKMIGLCKYCFGCNKLELEDFKEVTNCNVFICADKEGYEKVDLDTKSKVAKKIVEAHNGKIEVEYPKFSHFPRFFFYLIHYKY